MARFAPASDARTCRRRRARDPHRGPRHSGDTPHSQGRRSTPRAWGDRREPLWEGLGFRAGLGCGGPAGADKAPLFQTNPARRAPRTRNRLHRPNCDDAVLEDQSNPLAGGGCRGANVLVRREHSDRGRGLVDGQGEVRLGGGCERDGQQREGEHVATWVGAPRYHRPTPWRALGVSVGCFFGSLPPAGTAEPDTGSPC